jgi:CBS domain-containing protein
MRPSASSVSALRARYERRVERLTTLRHVRSELVSLAGLIGKPVTVAPDADLEEIAERLVESRHSSVVVVDEQERRPRHLLTSAVAHARPRRAELMRRYRHDRIREFSVASVGLESAGDAILFRDLR